MTLSVFSGVLRGTEANLSPELNTTGQRYFGFSPYKMDPKFRVSIQPGWRPAPGEVLRLLFSKTHGMPVIKVLTQESFDERVAVVEASDLTPAKKRATLDSLYMLCREASLNDQGKLLVPKDLSEKAGIEAEAEVILAGRGKHFEIWSKANHDRVLEIEMNQDDEDELGVL
ncbi:MAG: division/cell wall cluster transcriptional repressor MraZ [Luteolibacter sp.]